VLENGGHDVWWDRHIDSGSEFAGEIEAQLEKSDLVLVAWSKAAVRSPSVRDEAAIGRDRGRLLPVLIDGSRRRSVSGSCTRSISAAGKAGK
jgi:hypothetical protein